MFHFIYYFRIAIILHGDNEILEGEFQFSHGALEFKKRHLEILGYKVIIISPSIWTSLSSMDNEKIYFLKKSIGIVSWEII